MSSIRCIENCSVVVDRNGIENKENIIYGKWYNVNRLESHGIIDGVEYINVYLKDGGIINGIDRKVFELGKNDLVPVEDINVEEGLHIDEETERSLFSEGD